jgi:ComF family protein
MEFNMQLLKDLSNLVFPELCTCCEDLLVRGEKILCSKCLYLMPRTRFESLGENPVTELFWGRCEIHFAAALFRYNRGSPYQELIHSMKYRNRPELGFELGRLLGTEIERLSSGISRDVFDLLVPVPLHRRKLRKRGYNQCIPICEGLSLASRIPTCVDALERVSSSGTQTDKARFLRWKNVESVFRVRHPELLREKHVLLVDDVVTTGSTLEACAVKLLELEGIRVSVASLGVALKNF